MSNQNQPPRLSGLRCELCSSPLLAGGGFCPFCGAKSAISPSVEQIDAYVKSSVDTEIKSRLKDQAYVAGELADKAEETVKRRLRDYVIIISIFLAFVYSVLVYFGYGAWSKFEDQIDSAMRNRIAPVMRDAENKVSQVRASVADFSDRLNSFEGPAFKKIDDLTARANQSTKRLDDIERGLEAKVAQLTSRVNNVSVESAYPTLGSKKTVTLNGNSLEDKNAGGRRVNVSVNVGQAQQISQVDLRRLVDDLSTRGYAPLVGTLGVGGPYSYGSFVLGSNFTDSAVIYYSRTSTALASDVAGVVANDISAYRGIKPIFVDPASLNVDQRFILEHSGLLVQVYLSANSP